MFRFSSMNKLKKIIRTAEFVRGFFKFLELCDIRNAVLHGGTHGFEHELSDVDFCIDRWNFSLLPGLVNKYCDQQGWRLCQILVHETTAAYFVCSACDAPDCSVALDACSDYQRNGTSFLVAEELLGGRQVLSWGGYGLSPEIELRYRFAKAAAKNKSAIAVAAEFSCYPLSARLACEKWLKAKWGVMIISWGPVGVSLVLSQIRGRSNYYPSIWQSGSLARMVGRVVRPTGLIVIVGSRNFDIVAKRIEKVFGNVYFRKTRVVRCWRPGLIMDLISSGLIILPELDFPCSCVIPFDCVFHFDPSRFVSGWDLEVADFLHRRCISRSLI